MCMALLYFNQKCHIKVDQNDGVTVLESKPAILNWWLVSHLWHFRASKNKENNKKLRSIWHFVAL